MRAYMSTGSTRYDGEARNVYASLAEARRILAGAESRDLVCETLVGLRDDRPNTAGILRDALRAFVGEGE